MRSPSPLPGPRICFLPTILSCKGSRFQPPIFFRSDPPHNHISYNRTRFPYCITILLPERVFFPTPFFSFSPILAAPARSFFFSTSCRNFLLRLIGGLKDAFFFPVGGNKAHRSRFPGPTATITFPEARQIHSACLNSHPPALIFLRSNFPFPDRVVSDPCAALSVVLLRTHWEFPSLYYRQGTSLLFLGPPKNGKCFGFKLPFPSFSLREVGSLSSARPLTSPSSLTPPPLAVRTYASTPRNKPVSHSKVFPNSRFFLSPPAM